MTTDGPSIPIGKTAQQITTDELRKYLTSYQVQRGSSKVTIDNIRRILSSFFSWLEDEDFIVKSPVRRIRKVKTAKVIKDTYTDEALEVMRDNCSTTRDLAIGLMRLRKSKIGAALSERWLNDPHTEHLLYACLCLSSAA